MPNDPGRIAEIVCSFCGRTMTFTHTIARAFGRYLTMAAPKDPAKLVERASALRNEGLNWQATA